MMKTITDRKRAFVFCIVLGMFLYLAAAIIYSSFFSFPFKFGPIMTNEYTICENLQKFMEKVDIELSELNLNDTENQKNSNIRDFFTRNCQKFPNLFFLDASNFKKHQQETSNLIKNHYMNITSELDSQKPKNCGKFPGPSDLNITATYWQVTNTSNGTFYLYNAYYDNRLGIDGPPFVRILGMINIVQPTVKTYCQFWYENVTQPLISEVFEYRYIWNVKWGSNKNGATPYLISCRSPLAIPPKHVSLVEHRCGYANNLMEVKNKRPKNSSRELFIVSVKKLDYLDDVSLQIVEWCEILKIMGVNKVEIYVLNVHKNVLNVLKFYEAQNFVKIKFLKFPSELPNERRQSWHQWIQNELISFHDTFYENMYSYEYLIPMDTDEFFMPLNPEDRTWKNLLYRTIKKSLDKKIDYDCYSVDNHYFLLKSSHANETIQGIPKYLYFLPNIYRAANFTPNGGNAKTFLKMDRVLTIHNHFPFSCLDKKNDYTCKRFNVAREDGQLSHYRHECVTDECKESLQNPVKDVSLWKYKSEILEALKVAIEQIKIFTANELVFKLE